MNTSHLEREQTLKENDKLSKLNDNESTSGRNWYLPGWLFFKNQTIFYLNCFLLSLEECYTKKHSTQIGWSWPPH